MAISIMTTSLVIESVSPAFVGSATSPWVSASFTPPNNSILVVLAAGDWFGATPTLTPTSSGLTFSSQTKQGANNQGVTQIWTSEVGSSGGSARTVSVATDLSGSPPGAVKVWVVSGQHATLYVDAVTGGTGSTTNDFDGTITTNNDGCQVFGIAGDWQNLGNATSYDLFETAAPGAIAPISVRKANETAEAGVENINFNASTLTSAPLWTWAAIAIRPATYTKPAIFKRPLRARVSNLTAQTSTAAALANAGTIQVGSYLVASVAIDNSGSSGAATTLSITDPRSNTWTVLAAVNQDPGAASAGTTAYIAYAEVVNAYTNGDSLTFNYGNSTTAKAIVVEEYGGIDGTTPIAVSQVGATGASTAPTATISPTAADQLIVGALAYEAADNVTYTADTDTTNGIWAKQASIGTTSGTSASNQVIRTVSKLVSASGSQTWNSTIATNDWAEALIVFAPAASGPTPITGSESNSLTITESSSLASSSSSTDGAAISVSESVSILKTSGVTDGGSIAVSESVATTIGFSSTDGGSIAVSDVSSISISDTKAGTESNSLAVSESVSILVTVSATESNSLTISDVSATIKSIPATDTAAITITESSALFKAIDVTDGAAISVSDVAAVSGFSDATASDAAAITITETSSLVKQIDATDTAAISVSETTAKFSDTPGADGGSIAVSEVSDVVISGLIIKSATDTAQIAVSDVSTPNVQLSRTDTASIAASEVSGEAVTESKTDTAAISVDDVSTLTKTLVGTESNSLSVSEVADIIQTVAIAASDSIAISVTDSGATNEAVKQIKIYVAGVWHVGTLQIYIGGAWHVMQINIRGAHDWS